MIQFPSKTRTGEEWIFPTVNNVEYECLCEVIVSPSYRHEASIAGGYVVGRDVCDGLRYELDHVKSVSVAGTDQLLDIWPDGIESAIERELEERR